MNKIHLRQCLRVFFILSLAIIQLLSFFFIRSSAAADGFFLKRSRKQPNPKLKSKRVNIPQGSRQDYAPNTERDRRIKKDGAWGLELGETAKKGIQKKTNAGSESRITAIPPEHVLKFIRDSSKPVALLYVQCESKHDVTTFQLIESLEKVPEIANTDVHDPNRKVVIGVVRVCHDDFDQLNVSFTPCLKLYHTVVPETTKRVALTYRGGSMATETVVRWLRYYRERTVAEISSLSEIQFFAENFDVFLLGAFESRKGLGYISFVNAASYDEVPFAYTSSRVLMKELQIERFSSLALIKQRYGRLHVDPMSHASEKKDKFQTLKRVLFRGEIESTNQIDAFVFHNQLPEVTRWSQRVHAKIFRGPFSRHVILFLDERASSSRRVLDAFGNVADFVCKNIFGSTRPVFVFVSSREIGMLSHFGVTSMPQIIFVERQLTRESVLKRLDPSKELTLTTMMQFLVEEMDIFRGRERPPQVSDLLRSTSSAVQRITSENFRELVSVDDVNVAILFYHSKQKVDMDLRGAFEALANAYKDRPNIAFAEVDTSAEIIDPLQISIDEQRGIVLFPSGAEKKSRRASSLGALQELLEFSGTPKTCEGNMLTDIDTLEEENQRKKLLEVGRWFRVRGLGKWWQFFVDLGVESISDLEFITRNDLKGMGMSVVHQRKYFAAYATLNLPPPEVLE